jgi:hypothetical protein
MEQAIEDVRVVLQRFQAGGAWRFHTIHWSMPVD